MPVTMKDVRAWLDAEEVDYESAKKLGRAAIPFLMELVQGGDLGLASKATYLASMIRSAQAAEVVKTAARRDESVLRVAAASGIRNLSVTQAEKVLDMLSDDPDIGIRKVALTSALQLNSPRVVSKLQQMAESDPEPFIRDLAASTVEKINRASK